MNQKQKSKIIECREAGLGYASIARILGLTKAQVACFCKRQGLNGTRSRVSTKQIPKILYCPECCEPIIQRPGYKKRRFCSPACRQTWWNKNQVKVNRRANYNFICANCGQQFGAYGNSKRIYCSHSCYITHRFKNSEITLHS